MMMSEIPSELKKDLELAIQNAGMVNYLVDNGKDNLSQIEKTYVRGNPRVWWLSLQFKKKIIPLTDNTGYKHIDEFVKDIQGIHYKPEQDVFLIVDDDDFQHIYNIHLHKITMIIENCRYFEYYLVAHDLSWLICENDHGDIIVCQK